MPTLKKTQPSGMQHINWLVGITGNTAKNIWVDTEHMQTAFLLPALALQHLTRLNYSQGSCTVPKLSCWRSQQRSCLITHGWSVLESEAVPQAFMPSNSASFSINMNLLHLTTSGLLWPTTALLGGPAVSGIICLKRHPLTSIRSQVYIWMGKQPDKITVYSNGIVSDL